MPHGNGGGSGRGKHPRPGHGALLPPLPFGHLPRSHGGKKNSLTLPDNRAARPRRTRASTHEHLPPRPQAPCVVAPDQHQVVAQGVAEEAFHHARQRGWVRFIGVTGHHDPEVLRRALTLFEFDTALLPVNPAEPQHASFLPLAQEAAAKGMGVIAMKTLCRGQLPQMAEEPDRLVRELLAYALSQSVTLAVVGADSAKQVEHLAAAVREFTPMTPEEALRLEAAVAPYARQLMYYKP